MCIVYRITITPELGRSTETLSADLSRNKSFASEIIFRILKAISSKDSFLIDKGTFFFPIESSVADLDPFRFRIYKKIYKRPAKSQRKIAYYKNLIIFLPRKYIKKIVIEIKYLSNSFFG